MTRNQAAAEVRALANACIEQMERQAKGWDKGVYRDDDTFMWITIKAAQRQNAAEAFRLSAAHA